MSPTRVLTVEWPLGIIHWQDGRRVLTAGQFGAASDGGPRLLWAMTLIVRLGAFTQVQSVAVNMIELVELCKLQTHGPDSSSRG